MSMQCKEPTPLPSLSRQIELAYKVRAHGESQQGVWHQWVVREHGLSLNAGLPWSSQPPSINPSRSRTAPDHFLKLGNAGAVNVESTFVLGATSVAKLHDHAGAVLVAHVGDALHAGDAGIAFGKYVAGVGLALARHGRVGCARGTGGEGRWQSMRKEIKDGTTAIKERKGRVHMKKKRLGYVAYGLCARKSYTGREGNTDPLEAKHEQCDCTDT